MPYARQAFAMLSENRRRVSNWLGLVSDRDLVDVLQQRETPGCAVRGPA
jgi:hypothetical protein